MKNTELYLSAIFLVGAVLATLLLVLWMIGACQFKIELPELEKRRPTHGRKC